MCGIITLNTINIYYNKKFKIIFKRSVLIIASASHNGVVSAKFFPDSLLNPDLTTVISPKEKHREAIISFILWKRKLRF
jgi:hypothetical protein